MTQLACREIVFHFNKKHLEDETIPMWSLKTRGQTYYVQHVTCDVPWNTKETPDNSHTKGAIKIKNANLTIDCDNNAWITPLNEGQTISKSTQKEPMRIGWPYTSDSEVKQFFNVNNVTHSVIKWLSAGCTQGWYVCDVYDSDLLIQMRLTLGNGFRQFVSNEWQYKDYELMNDVDDEDECSCVIKSSRSCHTRQLNVNP